MERKHQRFLDTSIEFVDRKAQIMLKCELKPGRNYVETGVIDFAAADRIEALYNVAGGEKTVKGYPSYFKKYGINYAVGGPPPFKRDDIYYLEVIGGRTVTLRIFNGDTYSVWVTSANTDGLDHSVVDFLQTLDISELLDYLDNRAVRGGAVQ